MYVASDLSNSNLTVRRQPRPMWRNPSRADYAAEDRQRQRRSDAVPQWQAMQRLSQPRDPVYPFAMGRPVIQSGPFATGRPVIHSGPCTTGRPVVQSGLFATGRPVIQSDPFVTGRLNIQSVPPATERPVIESERSHRWPCWGNRGIGSSSGCRAVLCAPPQAPQREQGRDYPCQQGGAWR